MFLFNFYIFWRHKYFLICSSDNLLLIISIISFLFIPFGLFLISFNTIFSVLNLNPSSIWPTSAFLVVAFSSCFFSCFCSCFSCFCSCFFSYFSCFCSCFFSCFCSCFCGCYTIFFSKANVLDIILIFLIYSIHFKYSFNILSINGFCKYWEIISRICFTVIEFLFFPYIVELF